MKVLDPQSALLTLSELQHFLTHTSPRPREKKTGAYQPTDLSDHDRIRKDLKDYTTEITPHVTRCQDPGVWMATLVRRLKGFELTKTEVLNLVDVGVGRRKTSEGQTVESGEEEELSEEERVARDVLVFKCVVEEVDLRFAGDSGGERIKEIIEIFRDTIIDVEGS